MSVRGLWTFRVYVPDHCGRSPGRTISVIAATFNDATRALRALTRPEEDYELREVFVSNQEEWT